MRIEVDDHHFFGSLPVSHERIIKELGECDSDGSFVSKLSSLTSWKQLDHEQTDLKAWKGILNRIDAIFEKHVKYNQSRLILVPFAESDVVYAQGLVKELKESQTKIGEIETLKKMDDEILSSMKVLLSFIKLLLQNGRNREVFNSIEYIREFLAAESEELEFLAMEILFEIVKIPESHKHVEERDEEVETKLQGDIGLSKLLLCFAQGYGSKSQGLDLSSVLTKAQEMLPEFPGKLVFDFHRIQEKPLKQSMKDLHDLLFPQKKVSKKIAKQQDSGLVKIIISPEDLQKTTASELFRRIVRRYQVPRKIYFSFLQRLKMAKSYLSIEGRIRRTRMRLKSLAILFKICANEELMPAYMIHEPELAAEITELVSGISASELRSTEDNKIPFEVRVDALKVLQRLPGSTIESGGPGSLSQVGKNSNVLQHLGVMKGQTNGLLTNYLRSLCNNLDQYFPIECPDKMLTEEESKTQAACFSTPEEELCFAFGLSFAMAATEYDEESMEYTKKVFSTRDEINKRRQELTRLQKRDDLFCFYENILLLCGEVTGTSQGAVLLATTGIMNSYSAVILNEVESRRKMNTMYLEDFSQPKFYFNEKRAQLISQIVFTLSALIAISSFALSLAHEIEIAALILSYIEEILLKAFSENSDRKQEKRSRKSKTKKARSKRKRTIEIDVKLSSSEIMKEPSRLVHYVEDNTILPPNSVNMSELVLLRNLFQFLVILVQRSVESKRPSFRIKEDQSKLLMIFKIMFSNSHVFGTSTFNMMSTLFIEVVNFEPSSVYNLYRNNVQVLICDHILEDKLPTDPQTICNLPNFLSVLCLHSEGEKYLEENKIVEKLVDYLFKPELLYNCTQVKQNLETNECEEVYEMCAQNLDHFLRNHKKFRKVILEKFLNGLISLTSGKESKDTSSVNSDLSGLWKNEDHKNKTKLLSSVLKLFSLLVKNKDVGDSLFKMTGTIDKLAHCYLLTLPKSVDYLVRSSEPHMQRSASKVLTEIMGSLFYHEQFPFIMILKLRKTLSKLKDVDKRYRKQYGGESFRLMSLLPENVSFGDMKVALEKHKTGNKMGLNFEQDSWKESALMVKSLAYIEWLAQLLLSWIDRIPTTQNSNRKASSLFTALSTKKGSKDYTTLLQDLYKLSMKIVEERILFQDEFIDLKTEYEKLDDDVDILLNRNIRYVVNLELERFNNTINKLLVKVNDTYVASNKTMYRAANLSDVYNDFLNASIFRLVDDVLSKDTWLEKEDSLYFRSQKLGLIALILMEKVSEKRNIYFAYRLYENKYLDKLIECATEIFFETLEIVNDTYRVFKTEKELKKFLKTADKILFDVSQFFYCIQSIAETSLKSVSVGTDTSLKSTWKSYWDTRAERGSDITKEILAYPFHHKTFALQLKMSYVSQITRIVSNEKISILGFTFLESNEHGALRKFFQVVNGLTFKPEPSVNEKNWKNTTFFPEQKQFDFLIDLEGCADFETYEKRVTEFLAESRRSDKYITGIMKTAIDTEDVKLMMEREKVRLEGREYIVTERAELFADLTKRVTENYLQSLVYLRDMIVYFRQQNVLKTVPMEYCASDGIFYFAQEIGNIISVTPMLVEKLKFAGEKEETLCNSVLFAILNRYGNLNIMESTMKDSINSALDDLKRIISSFTGTERNWKSCLQLCPLLLNISSYLVGPLENKKDIISQFTVPCLNLLKIMNKVQAKRCLFTGNEIAALLSVWERLLTCIKAREAFLKNHGLNLVFQLRVHVDNRKTTNIVSNIFLRLFTENKIAKKEHFKACLTSQFERSKQNVAARKRARNLKLLKSTIIILHEIDSAVLMEALSEAFDIKVQPFPKVELDKNILISRKPDTNSTSSDNKQPKKLDKIRSLAFQLLATELIKVIRKDLQDQSKKKKRGKSERLLNAQVILSLLKQLQTEYPFYIDELLLTNIENKDVLKILDETSKVLKIEKETSEKVKLISVLVSAFLPLVYIFKKVDAPLVVKKELEPRFELSSVFLDFVTSSVEMVEVTKSNTAVLLINELCWLLKSIEDAANNLQDKKVRVKPSKDELKAIVNRMWIIQGIIEELKSVVIRNRGKIKETSNWVQRVKALFENHVVKLLVKSFNYFVPYHSKLFQIVGTVLALLDPITKPEALKKVRPNWNSDLPKREADFLESLEDPLYEYESDIVEDSEDEFDNVSESDFELSGSSEDDFDDDDMESIETGDSDSQENLSNIELINDGDGIDVEVSSGEDTSTQIEDDATSEQDMVVEEDEYDEDEDMESEEEEEGDGADVDEEFEDLGLSESRIMEQSNIVEEDIRSFDSLVDPLSQVPERRQNIGRILNDTQTNRRFNRRNNIFGIFHPGSQVLNLNSTTGENFINRNIRTVLQRILEERRGDGNPQTLENFSIRVGQDGEHFSFRMNFADINPFFDRPPITETTHLGSSADGFSMINAEPLGLRLPGISLYFLQSKKKPMLKRVEKRTGLLSGYHPLLVASESTDIDLKWKQILDTISKVQRNKKKTTTPKTKTKTKKATVQEISVATPENQRQPEVPGTTTITGSNIQTDAAIPLTLDIDAINRTAQVSSTPARRSSSNQENNTEVEESRTNEAENATNEPSNMENIETNAEATPANENQNTSTSTTQQDPTEDPEYLQNFIAGISDMQLRREVFLNLTPAQIASLPEALQAESQIYRTEVQMPTTFIPAVAAPTQIHQAPAPNFLRPFSSSSSESRSKKKKVGIALNPDVLGFEDMMGEKEVECLMKLLFHLRQGKKSSHKSVLWNLCEHSLYREIVLYKLFQLIEPDVPYLNLCVRKSIDRKESSFKLEFSLKSKLSEAERKKLRNDKKWCPVKMIGTSETIFTRYASQLHPISGFIPFLAFRRVLELLRFVSSRSKRVCLILLEREGAFEFLCELLSVKQYFSNVKFLTIMVEILAHVVSPLAYYSSESKSTDKVYVPKGRIIEKKYLVCILNLFASPSCSEEIFVKLKAPLKHLSVIKENCESILTLAAKEASKMGKEAISELHQSATTDLTHKQTSSELMFYRMLRVIKDISLKHKDIKKDYLTLLNIDLKRFLDGFVISIKEYAKKSTFIFPLKRAISLADLGLGDHTPRAKRTASSLPSKPLVPVATPPKSPLAKPKKNQVHSMALAVAQTKLTMFKCFLHVCYIQGIAAEPMLIEFVHRFKNVLNSLIHQNSSLLDHDFKIILMHPKCKHAIDFYNKRQFFRNQVKKIKNSKRNVRLSVRREDVYADSYNILASKPKDEMLGKLSVQFRNEEGVDAGGVAREYYQILCRQMFDPAYCLFSASADSSAIQPDSKSVFTENHLDNFKFIGRMVAKAILEGILIDAHFTRSFYKHILGLPIDYKDIDSIDPQYYKSLCDLLVMNIDDLGLELTFTTDEKEFGVVKTVELKPNGRNIKVTDENKMEYVQLCTLHKMTTGIKDQIEAFLKGFYEIVPLHLISIFTEPELELLICGVPEVDLDDLQNNTDYVGYTSESQQVKWFWKILKNWPKEDHAKFLMFVTGTSKVPLGGFKNLVGMRGTQKFSIHKAFKNDQVLPSAHTCFNQLDLPEYSSEKILKEKLSYAVQEGGEGFGFR